MNQPPEIREDDRPPAADRGGPSADRAVSAWNVEAARRLERLSVREQAERRAVAAPEGGVGFRFGSRRCERGQVMQLLDSLPPEQRRALQDPQARVFLTTLASRVGSRDYNDRLAQERGEDLAAELRRLGAQSQIVIDAVGFRPAEDRDAPAGQDDRNDRVAYVDVLPARRGPRAEQAPARLDRPDRELIERGIRAFEASDSPVKGWALGMLRLFQQPDADDRVLRVSAYLYDNNRAGARVLDPTGEGYIVRARPEMVRAIQRSTGAASLVRNVEERVRHLAFIGYGSAQRHFARYGLGGASSMSEAERRAKDWVAGQQRNARSVYSCWLRHPQHN